MNIEHGHTYFWSYEECVGEVTSNAWKILFSMPVVSVAERPWRRRSLYQDTTASSKVMEDRSIVLCRRFASNMLMRVVPGARGAQTYSAVVGSWRDQIMLRRPGGWQWRASSLMMRALSKSVVDHRRYVLMAILDIHTRCCRMTAKVHAVVVTIIIIKFRPRYLLGVTSTSGHHD
jgi:hypothetical protein